MIKDRRQLNFKFKFKFLITHISAEDLIKSKMQFNTNFYVGKFNRCAVDNVYDEFNIFVKGPLPPLNHFIIKMKYL